VIKWTLIFRGVPYKIWEDKKLFKIRRDFWQLSTLIANISGTDRHVKNLNSTWSTTFHPLLEEKFVELWSTNQKSICAQVDPPKWMFFKGALAPEIFTRTRDWPRCASTLPKRGQGSPKNFKGEHLKFDLKLSTWVPITLGLVGITSRNFSMWPAWGRHDNEGMTFGGPPSTKFGRAKNVQNLARFFTTFDFDRKYLRNRSTWRKSEIHLINYKPSPIERKKLVNFGPLTQSDRHWC